jgi:Magnesium chelatase, subunit ChlI
VPEEATLDVSQPLNRSALDLPFNLVLDLFLRRTLLEETTSLLKLRRALGLSGGVLSEAFDELRGRKYLDVQSLSGNDYIFSLTTYGRDEARNRFASCQYSGVAPVTLETYQRAVMLQKASMKVNRASIRNAFSDLVVSTDMLDQLGPAFNSQHSIFFYGPAGTGKTSLAERLVRLYPDFIIVPKAVVVEGQFIMVYDPVVHEALPDQPEDLDPRWVACKRPLVVAGGELVMENLFLSYDEISGVYTAPLQVKANNGMFLIDDFGRQVLTPEQLLNRWIYPLVKRVDYLSLRTGVKFAMPFELMVLFSTNMDPDDLGDEAFFRRVKNKVFVGPVNEQQFGEILVLAGKHEKVTLTEDTFATMTTICRTRDPIGLRANYPWDLSKMAKSICEYEERETILDARTLEAAARLYWADNGTKAMAATPAATAICEPALLVTATAMTATSVGQAAPIPAPASALAPAPIPTPGPTSQFAPPPWGALDTKALDMQAPISHGQVAPGYPQTAPGAPGTPGLPSVFPEPQPQTLHPQPLHPQPLQPQPLQPLMDSSGPIQPIPFTHAGTTAAPQVALDEQIAAEIASFAPIPWATEAH